MQKATPLVTGKLERMGGLDKVVDLCAAPPAQVPFFLSYSEADYDADPESN